MENKQKKGISLIVLVITIIVMIILAAAIILSLNGSGIIGKANEAKTSSDLANAKHVAALAKAEWDLMNADEREDAGNDLKKYVEDKLNAAGMKGFEVDAEGKILEEGGASTTYTIYTDSAKKTAPIPNGFTVSTIPGETTIAGGLVIYEGTEPVTDADSDSNGIIDAQETRNQFVWVPVDVPTGKTFAQIFQRTTKYKPTEDITDPGNVYVEPYKTSTYTEEETEYLAMRESVEANGGFYIGRYEAGTTTERIYGEDNGTTELVVRKDKFVYNNVSWGESMTNTTGNVNSGGVNVGLGVVELSRNMYKNSTSVVSALCYGVQWDAALRFIATNVEHEEFPYDSTGKGYYAYDENWNQINEEKVELTGRYETNNIYDMAGNVWEYTMESYYTKVDGEDACVRVIRGGTVTTSADNEPASSRLDNSPDVFGNFYGFRVTLYIK